MANSGFSPIKGKFLSWVGNLYRATDYDAINENMPVPTNTNLTSIQTILEGGTYIDVWDFEAFNASFTRENEETYTSQKCRVGTFSRIFDKRASFNFNLFDYLKPETLVSFIWWNQQDVAGAPTNVADPAQENLGINAWVGQIVRLDNKNADNTVVTGVTINLWGTVNADGTVTWGAPLTITTDYVVNVDVDGTQTWVAWASYITFITAQTGQLSAEYTYTPVDRKLVAQYLTTIDQEFMTLKLVTCWVNGYDIEGVNDPTKTVYDEIYLHKCSLTSDYTANFDGKGEGNNTPALTFTGEDGGMFFWNRYAL